MVEVLILLVNSVSLLVFIHFIITFLNGCCFVGGWRCFVRFFFIHNAQILCVICAHTPTEGWVERQMVICIIMFYGSLV